MHFNQSNIYHVGPVDNCSAVSPAAQDLSLEHLGVITARTHLQTNLMIHLYTFEDWVMHLLQCEWKGYCSKL